MVQKNRRRKEYDPFYDPFERLRKPVASKPGVTFRSKKDYNRKHKRKVIERELKEFEGLEEYENIGEWI
jgi:hypothetical protein